MRRYLMLSLLVAVAAVPLPAMSSETADAEALVEKYLKAFSAPDPMALAALYAEDGIVLPPTGGPVRGREAIGRYWSASGRRGLSFDILQKNVCGDAGFFVGKYSARETPSGQFVPANGSFFLAGLSRREVVDGNFVLCVKRGENGSWKIATDMWNQNLLSGFISAAQPRP